jgi:hypothetical protein
LGEVRFTLVEHDSTFDGNVIGFLKATGLDPTRTGIQVPWQNGVAERWVGSCRRELLDSIIALNERHLYRLIRAYVDYYARSYSCKRPPRRSRRFIASGGVPLQFSIGGRPFGGARPKMR